MLSVGVARLGVTTYKEIKDLGREQREWRQQDTKVSSVIKISIDQSSRWQDHQDFQAILNYIKGIKRWFHHNCDDVCLDSQQCGGRPQNRATRGPGLALFLGSIFRVINLAASTPCTVRVLLFCFMYEYFWDRSLARGDILLGF